MSKMVYPIILLGASAVANYYLASGPLRKIEGRIESIETKLQLGEIGGKWQHLDVQKLLARQENYEAKTSAHILKCLCGDSDRSET